MHLLSSILHEGKFPESAPEWLPINFTSWEKFDPEFPKKNFISIESLAGNDITQESKLVPEERLNNFYVFNELVQDLEADRKGFCESKFIPENSKKSEKPVGQRQNMTFLEVSLNTPIKLDGIKVRKSEWATIYPSVRYATAERFENSYLTDNFSDENDTPTLCPTSGGRFLDEDCLKMSIILPNLKYYNSMIYFKTEETNDLDYLENLAYDRKTAIFAVNLRSETLGYFQSPVIQSDLINSLRWIAQNLETFELYPENVMIYSNGHINELLFDLFIRFQDISVLQIPFNIFFIQLWARTCFREYKKYFKMI